jgi:small subunit ribosomal protein S3
MGQKTNPKLFRLGHIIQADSLWVEEKKYAKTLGVDIQIRAYIEKHYNQCGISKILIERHDTTVKVTIVCARPGVIIGRKGADIESLRAAISIAVRVPIQLSVREVQKVELDPRLVAENIAGQIERRVQVRKSMKRAIQGTMRAGAKGVRVVVSGRLGGAEIARNEKYTEGRLPLSTIRANIDYYHAMAKTTYGIIGVKVWIYLGDIYLDKDDK